MKDRSPRNRVVSRLAGLAVLLATVSSAGADFTSRLQVGNWKGGAWADNTSKQFMNCGLTLELSGGTAISIIVPASLTPAIMLADQRIKATPRQPIPVRAKFGTEPELQLNAMGINPTMVQIAMPAWPHHYDKMRNAQQAGFIVPELNTTLNVSGIAQALPQVIGCALAERAKLANPPSPAPAGQPFEKTEAALAGLVIAERSGIGPYIVFTDDKRPGNFQGAAMVAGFVGAPGPGGQANILVTAYWTGPLGNTVAEAKQALIQRLKGIDPKAQLADLPGIPGKPNSFGLSSLGNNVYEEVYMIQKPGVGFFQFTSSTPAAGRATAEAAGVKLRSAISLVVPYP